MKDGLIKYLKKLSFKEVSDRAPVSPEAGENEGQAYPDPPQPEFLVSFWLRIFSL